MIDQTSQFFAILTNVGLAKQANADALGIAWKITQMGVGDANGTEPMPSATQTALINERRRAPLNQLKVDPTNSAIIIAEQVIPEDVGGWWIREIGLYDADGDLVAIANCAPSFKPLLTQGSGRTQVVRMNMIVSNASNVELKIDPSVVLATRAYVDAKVLEELNKLDSKQSVRVATTANIALAGLQTIDAVALVAGDRVLVKNQALAKDNGIYVVSNGVWVRSTDADLNAEVTSALVVAVEQGATLADTRWQLVTDGAIVLGTTALTFQDVTQGFAALSSPTFTGLPKAPTLARFDNTKGLVTAEFLNDSMGGLRRTYYSLTQGQIMTPAMVNSLIYAGAGVTGAVLPLLSSVPYGSTLTFAGMSAPIVLQRQGADTIWATSANSALTAISVNLGDTLTLTATSFGWVATGGSAMFAHQGTVGAFAATLVANGKQRLPSGLLRQWGQVTPPVGSDLAVTFPEAFANRILSLVVTPYIGGTSTRATTVMVRTDGLATTGFSVGTFLSGTRINEAVYWVAEGY